MRLKKIKPSGEHGRIKFFPSLFIKMAYDTIFDEKK